MGDRLKRLAVALLPFGLVLLVGWAAWLHVEDKLDAQRSGSELVFHRPWALALVLTCVLLAWVSFVLHSRRSATFSFSRVADLRWSRRGVVSWLSSLPRVLRLVAIGLIAVALARPQAFKRQEIEVEGIDIMLVLDLSRSMEERDLLRDRLDAAQRTIRKFLIGRKNDRVGLVVFAKEAMLQCPLTLDYSALDHLVADLAIGDIEPMGTAIGDGLGVALASFRRSDAKSKVIILLTDGDSNVINEMDPDEATRIAKDMNVRVFTVLMGREAGTGSSLPPMDLFGRQPYAVNPQLLKRMAAETNGKYFHAGDSSSLDRGFEEVRSTLELSKRKEIGKVYSELFPVLVQPALALLLLEVLLTLTRFRRFP
ncbi:MAG: VWA domain-containing protein [Deltaproteobacteria bacterium]|nr:VWA domain-containing protein [Deltaproteobacteria bacterium]